MKEYTILIKQGSGRSYYLKSYDSLEQAKIELYEMVNLCEERSRPYYVDNDFFNNKYNLATKLRYFCLKEREVTEWEKYSEENSKKNVYNNSNIIFFRDIKT